MENSLIKIQTYLIFDTNSSAHYSVDGKHILVYKVTFVNGKLLLRTFTLIKIQIEIKFLELVWMLSIWVCHMFAKCINRCICTANFPLKLLLKPRKKSDNSVRIILNVVRKEPENSFGKRNSRDLCESKMQFLLLCCYHCCSKWSFNRV